MSEHKSWYLKQIYLFEGISDDEIMGIANKLIEKECQKKELIYTPFESENSVCILKKGEVTLYYSHNGKKIIIDVLKPGSIFGDISFGEAKSDHFAEVTENALVCYMDNEDFKKNIQSKPEIMFRLVKLMSNRLMEYEKKIKGGLFDAKEKIIHHLDLVAQKSSLSKLLSFKSKTSHEKIAHHTGLSRETVTRAISALKKEGRIFVSDVDGIVKL